ncbi:hypothetical protein L6164_002775 [Bauhinia variegata]|uniref:Uncharacterized protein n=1 Tax=Bauhinia variegata TaxID=167791 RepID=A0ACB9Q1C8_BAUVA|nr:hypothetical protein L6164_002775 [Bauhinia variegata]
MNLSIANLPRQLSFSRALTSSDCLFIRNKLSQLSISQSATVTRKPSIICMGCPKTYPGGVSKYKWRKIKARRDKELKKVGLCREIQIYKMRKRAELKAAVSELERPWEEVERASNLFSVKADQQDRFQKPVGLDIWTERDEPQLSQTPDELPSARFSAKGVRHGIKPYRKISEYEDGSRSQVDKNVIEDQESKTSRRSSIRKLRSRSSGVEHSSNAESSSINFLKSSTNNGIIEEQWSKRGRRSSNGKLSSRSYGQGRELSDLDEPSDVESSLINSVESSISNGINRKKINGKLRERENRRKVLFR